MDMEEVFKKYLRGLKELEISLKEHLEASEKVEKLNQQLIDNIDSVQTFGDSDSLRKSRKPIVEQLNHISYEMLGKSFNKICGLTEVDINDYRQDFRNKVLNLYKSLGFEISQDKLKKEIRADFLIYYTMPMQKAYKCLVKSVLTVEDIVSEEIISRFAATLDKARSDGIADMGELVTDIGFTPEAKQIAQQNNIQLLTYSECVNGLIDFERYVDQLIYDYEHFEEFEEGTRQSFIDILENCDLAKKYIDPRFSDVNGNIYNSFDTYIESWLKTENKNELLIMGEPGYGKTSVMLHTAYQLALRYKKSPAENRIPLFITLKDCGKLINIKQMITNILINRYQLNFSSYSAFETLLNNQKFVLFFDGLDEIAFKNDTAWAEENFKELSKLLIQGGKAIFTSDSGYLLHQKYAKEIFSPEEDKTSKIYTPKYDVLFIQNLDGKQLSDFLKARTQNWQAFYIKIKSVPELYELAKNPIVFEMMWQTLVQVIRENKPFRDSSFYEMYTNSWFQKEDDDSIMSAPEKADFVEELALEMLRNGRLHIHNKQISPSIREHYQDLLRNYSELDVFAYDIGTCPFLSEDLEGNYKFKHKSLVDFFVAKKYIKNLKNGELHIFNNVQLPFEVKKYIVELMPKIYVNEDDKLKKMVKIPSGNNTHPFWLDKYPVTNSDYAEFIAQTKFEPPKHWVLGAVPKGKENHPVVNVSWKAAVLYAKWSGKHLPTENEWEKASGYEDGRFYPWGNEFKKENCNSIETGKMDTTPVNSFKENKSPCNCADMAGNVWEWTSSWVDEKRKDKGYVAKGGSFLSDAESLTSKNGLIYRELRVDISEAIGFRCAAKI